MKTRRGVDDFKFVFKQTKEEGTDTTAMSIDGSSSEAPDGELSADVADDDVSDAEDVFNLGELAAESFDAHYKSSFLYRWKIAITTLRNLLRPDVLLPLHPDLGGAGVVWKNLNTAIKLALWHCCFADCLAVDPGHGNHESGLWNHLWNAHSKEFTRIIKRFRLEEPFQDLPAASQTLQETAFTLYSAALCEVERQSVPLLGIAFDRRALSHLGEVFKEDNISVLMCFICSCKHICHQGFDKLGRVCQKGTIALRPNTPKEKELLCTEGVLIDLPPIP